MSLPTFKSLTNQTGPIALPDHADNAVEKARALDAYNKQMEDEARIETVLRAAIAREEAFTARLNQAKAVNAGIEALNASRMRLRKRLWIASIVLIGLGVALALISTLLMGGW